MTTIHPPHNASRQPPHRGSDRKRRLHESTVKKKILGLAVFLIIALSTLNALFGERGVRGLRDARTRHDALAMEIEALRTHNERMAEEIHALRTDPLAIERQAREVLGMALPGEIAITVVDPSPP